jgi:hypothetical protein
MPRFFTYNTLILTGWMPTQLLWFTLTRANFRFVKILSTTTTNIFSKRRPSPGVWDVGGLIV